MKRLESRQSGEGQDGPGMKGGCRRVADWGTRQREQRGWGGWTLTVGPGLTLWGRGAADGLHVTWDLPKKQLIHRQVWMDTATRVRGFLDLGL